MAQQASARAVIRLLSEVEAGGRVCVPILGSGVNLQAARMEGHGNRDDWEGLLRRIAAEIGMSESAFRALPKSNLAKWETMLRQCAVSRGIKPYLAENDLQRLVCRELRSQERTASQCRLYGTFLNARFHDIVSLNFDRRVAICSGREIFRTRPKGKSHRAADETIYRHSIVVHDEGTATRIWYPHGDTKKCSTLKFGVRKYGDYIAGLEGQRRTLMAKWKEASSALRNERLVPPRDFDRATRCSAERPNWITWPMILLMSPLVFIGCSLAFDEWPLWWLLHQRARIFTSIDPAMHPPTVSLHVGGTPTNLQGSPCELQVIRFDTFDALWSAVCGALAQT